MSSYGASASEYVNLIREAEGNGGALLAARTHKPKTINCELRYYNSKSYPNALTLFGLMFDSDVVLVYADPSTTITDSYLSLGGVFTDNGNEKPYGMYLGLNTVSINIDVDTQLPNCFKEDKPYYNFKILAPYRAGDVASHGVVYINKLIIKF